MEVYITANPLITFQKEIYKRFTNYQKMSQRHTSATVDGNKIRYIVSPSINHTVFKNIEFYARPKDVHSIRVLVANGNLNNDPAFDFGVIIGGQGNDDVPGTEMHPNETHSTISDVTDDTDDVIAPQSGEAAPTTGVSLEPVQEQPLVGYTILNCSKDIVMQVNNKHDAIKTIVPLVGKPYIGSKFKSANLSLLIEVELEDGVEVNSSGDIPLLMANYYVALSHEEVNRFRAVSHESLIRRTDYITVNSDSFDLSFLKNKCCGLVIITSATRLTGEMKVSDFCTIKMGDIETRVVDGRYLLIFDADTTLDVVKRNAYQPCAYYDFGDTSRITLDSPAEFTISFAYHDVLRYDATKIELQPTCTRTSASTTITTGTSNCGNTFTAT